MYSIFYVVLSSWLLGIIVALAAENDGLPEQFSAETIFAVGKVSITNQVVRDHGQLYIQGLMVSTNLPDSCFIINLTSPADF